MQWRVRALVGLLPAVLAVGQVAFIAPAGGQTDTTSSSTDPPPTDPSTTTTEATIPFSFPPTTARPNDGLNSTRRKSLSTTTVPGPSNASAGGQPGGGTGGGGGGSQQPDNGNGPSPDTGPVAAPLVPGSADPNAAGGAGGLAQLSPDTVAAQLDSLARFGNNTRAVLDALSPLQSVGYTPEEAAMLGMGHFPVGGLATFRDDFGEARDGGARTHKGNDVFAAFNTPVRAPVDGTLRYAEENLGGNAAYVTTADGTYYYMAHLNAFAPDLSSGASVTQGQFIGLVGDSGNARGGTPHVHFEIHPGGGAAVDPNPMLNGWLGEALQQAPDLVASRTQGLAQAGAVISTGLTRRFDDRQFSAQVAPMVDPAMWESSVNPAGSAISLAEVNAARAAGSVNWDARAAEAEKRASDWQSAQQQAQVTLAPLSPPAINRLASGATFSSS